MPDITENKEHTFIDEEEFNAAVEAAKDSKDSITITLSTPFTYENKTYEKLTFDWGKLTGNDSLAIEHEMALQGKVLVAPEFSSEFMNRLAVRACSEEIALNALLALPLKEYNRIRGAARSFLISSGS